MRFFWFQIGILETGSNCKSGREIIRHSFKLSSRLKDPENLIYWSRDCILNRPRKRERKIEREKERQREEQRKRKSETEKQRQRMSDREKEREGKEKGERGKETERQRRSYE